MFRRVVLSIALVGVVIFIPFISLSHAKESETSSTIKAEAKDIVAAPKENEGRATEVAVNFAVLDISNIYDKEQKVTIDLFIALTWKDPRLAEKVTKGEMKAKTEDVWTPNIQILNDINLTKKMENAVHIQSDGTVTYRQRYVGDISERLNLRRFPRDKHTFKIKVATAGESENTINFVPGKMTAYFPINEEITVENWRFTPGKLSTKPITLKGLAKNIPGFTYTFEGKRKIGFYIWTLIVPLSVIIFMSWSVFWLDPQPELFGPQAGIATTSMLTVVAFRFVLVNFMPNVSYMTLIDRFLLGSIILVFLSLTEVILTSDLAKREKMKLALRVDRVSRWLFPIIFGGLFYYSFWF